MARRGHNEGTVFKWEEKNLWVAKISLPDGKRKTKYAKTQKEAREWLQTTLNQLRQGILAKDDNVTLGAFAINYMETVGKHTLRPKTMESYLSLTRTHIIPTIGKIKLSALRPDHLQNLYSQKLESGLSRRTVHYIHSIIHKLLDQALRWGMVVRNVSDLVDAPTPPRRKLTVWNKDQVNQFLDYTKVHNPRFYLVYLLCLYGGFREGEVLGLHRTDINLERGTVTVNHAAQYLLGQGVVITQPKTETSKRSIKLPPTVMEPLKDHLNQLDVNQKLLFVTASGKPINPRFLIKHFKDDLAAAGLPNIRVHDLRATMGSLMLSANIHPKVVQERLGHASITLTLMTYSSVLPDIQDEASEKLDTFLGRRVDQKVDQTQK